MEKRFWSADANAGIVTVKNWDGQETTVSLLIVLQAGGSPRKCQSGAGGTGCSGSVQRKERGCVMLYHTHNLTGCLVVLLSEASMRVFLRDRQRSVESKMRKAIKTGIRAGHPVADALITEMSLILALQDEMEGNRYGTKWWRF